MVIAGAGMKAFGIALAATLVMASATKADEIEDNGQWKAPKYEQLKAKWPHDAAGTLIYGKVLLDCGVGANGFAAQCQVKASEPANSALEQAALTLAPLYKALNPKVTRATLQVDVQYDDAVDWLRKPNGDDVAAAYPREAGRRGASGTAVIKCVVQTNGLVRACTLIREDQPGLGFGPAALVLSRIFLFKPAMRHGAAVESEISVPISFLTTGPIEGNGVVPIRVMSEMVWAKTPTISEILGEIDKKVGDKFADGQVVLQCRLDKNTGKLSNCTVANASPGMAQFSDVAQSLVPKFKADPAVLASISDRIIVNLAFAFPDMSSPDWSKRYLTHPRWVRTISPDLNKATFPEDAAKAGLKTGSATVDCVVAANGALTRCTVVRESNPNVGFGAMATQIAETFVANPWDEDGLPVDGAHVRMPIQMDYEPPADAPPAPAPTPATKP
jgi:TonB family protein